jgi:hypothetical protein
MTEQMSKEIVDVLSKYDTTHVCTLDAFNRIFKLTDYNNALTSDKVLREFNGRSFLFFQILLSIQIIQQTLCGIVWYI